MQLYKYDAVIFIYNCFMFLKFVSQHCMKILKIYKLKYLMPFLFVGGGLYCLKYACLPK